MNPSSRRTSLDRFLGALHRRMLMMRVLEHGGAGILIGSLASLIAVPILLWQDEPAAGFVWISIGLGAVAGIAWGFARRPTPVAAAIEADRQLRLSDLLSTALSIRATSALTSDPSWANTILALAEHRLSATSPRDVLMRRWGMRAWSGTALSVMLAITLSIFSPAADTSRAAIVNAGTRAETRKPGHTELPPMSSSLPAGHRPTRASSGPDEDGNRQIGGEPHADEKDAGSADQIAPKSAGADGSGAVNSAGSGNSRENPAKTRETSDRLPGSPSNAKDPLANAAKTQAAGRSGAASDGSANPSLQASEASSGLVTAGTSKSVAPPPPWKQSGWAHDAERAHDAINTGRVPDSYRDLVRDYFDDAR